MKKMAALVLAVMMVVMLAACGSSNGNSEQSNSSSNPANSSSNGSSNGSSNEVRTMKFAALETAYGKAVWEEVAAAFESKVPGVKVEMTIEKNIEDVIGPTMKSGDFPDAIHLAVGQPKGLTETFVKDNNMTDLTDVLAMKVPGEEFTVSEKIIPGFTDTTITNPYNDGKTYLMPMFYSPTGLFYK